MTDSPRLAGSAEAGGHDVAETPQVFETKESASPRNDVPSRRSQAEAKTSRRDAWYGLLASLAGAVFLAAVGVFEHVNGRRRTGCPNPCPIDSNEPCEVPSGCELGGSAFSLPTVILVVALIAAFVPGWVRAMRLPHQGLAAAIIGGTAALAVAVATAMGGLQLVYVAVFAIFAVFLGEMVRKDRGENLLEQIAGTYVGCLIVVSAAFWIVAVRDFEGVLTVSVAICAMSGSLGRHTSGARLKREFHSGWLIVWLAFYAFIGGLVLVLIIGPPFVFAIFVWVACIALAYGGIAGMTDLAARSLTGRRIAVGVAVVPYCVLGVISYAMALSLA